MGWTRILTDYFCSCPSPGAVRKIQNIKLAHMLCPEGGPGAEIAQQKCEESVRPKGPHVFYICIGQSRSPDRDNFGQFQHFFVFYIFTGLPGGLENYEKT